MASHYHQAHAAALQCVEPPPAPRKTPPPQATEPVNVDKVASEVSYSSTALGDLTRPTKATAHTKERPLTALHARAAKKAR